MRMPRIRDADVDVRLAHGAACGSIGEGYSRLGAAAVDGGIVSDAGYGSSRSGGKVEADSIIRIVRFESRRFYDVFRSGRLRFGIRMGMPVVRYRMIMRGAGERRGGRQRGADRYPGRALRRGRFDVALERDRAAFHGNRSRERDILR